MAPDAVFSRAAAEAPEGGRTRCAGASAGMHSKGSFGAELHCALKKLRSLCQNQPRHAVLLQGREWPFTKVKAVRYEERHSHISRLRWRKTLPVPGTDLIDERLRHRDQFFGKNFDRIAFPFKDCHFPGLVNVTNATLRECRQDVEALLQWYFDDYAQ